MKRPKLVVIGGGFGGLQLVHELRKYPFDITLVDKANHHLFQPLLYQVAVGALSPGDIATPLRYLIEKQQNVDTLLDKALRVDRGAKQVQLASGRVLNYDQLVVAVGNQPSYFGNDDWEQHAPGLKTLNDALAIRERLYLSFEQAARLEHPSERKALLTTVLIGGGPTGVELAGAIAEIARKTLLKDFRNLDPAEIRVILVEGGDGLLGGYHDSLSARAARDLQKMGVELRLGTFVKDVTEHGVQAGEAFIESKNVIWAAGNQAHSLVQTLGTALDKAGRVLVQPDLSLPDDPHVFVVGDAAHTKGPDGQPLPGVAQVALQQGAYLAKMLRKRLKPAERPAFRYNDKGNMATIGRAKAIVETKQFRLAGFWAWVIWSIIHVFYLITARARWRVFVEWIWYYVTFRPGARLIYTVPRKLLEKQPAAEKLTPEAQPVH